MDNARFSLRIGDSLRIAKKRLIPLAILLVAVSGGLVWFARLPGEPVYQGKPLGVWLEDYTESASESRDGNQSRHRQQAAAITHIGTNALPILLDMIQIKENATWSNLVFLLK